ncbi:Serine/threonine-protein kinase PrkC [Planctomycetales bacterium 10988]|nr:Serine/threonine-protein kinase PrkC [Planctomycetales bacterium 10988]
MSTTVQVETYLELLRRSGLVTAEHLDELLSSTSFATKASSFSTTQLSEILIEANLITPWHHRMLLKGLWRGFFLGRYKLLEELGAGGMSSVYLAEHALLRRRVAIKVLHHKRASSKANLTRFYRESRSTAALDHPNIVRVFDFDTDGKFHFLVMEYVEGLDLKALVTAQGNCSFEHAASYIAQAASGIQCAHENNLIHRDIKPANLLVTRNGTVKITDLGLAREINTQEESLTVDEGSVLGTVDYLAPEQAIDSHRVTRKVDVYSLGCSLYFALTGQPPYPEGTMAVRLLKHQTKEPEPIENFRPQVPPELVQICKSMMSKVPEERPTAAEVHDRLNRWLANENSPNLLEQSSDHLQSMGATTRMLSAEETMAERKLSPSVVASSKRAAAKPDENSDSTQTTLKKNPTGKIKISCHQCTTMLYAPIARIGQKAKCPACGSLVVISMPGAVPTKQDT